MTRAPLACAPLIRHPAMWIARSFGFLWVALTKPFGAGDQVRVESTELLADLMQIFGMWRITKPTRSYAIDDGSHQLDHRDHSNQ